MEKLSTRFPFFDRCSSQVWYFAHILNLRAKAILWQFDVSKDKKMNKTMNEVMCKLLELTESVNLEYEEEVEKNELKNEQKEKDDMWNVDNEIPELIDVEKKEETEKTWEELE